MRGWEEKPGDVAQVGQWRGGGEVKRRRGGKRAMERGGGG